MSHNFCRDCGSNQFEHIDGRLYCVECQSQSVTSTIHVSFANEASEQLGRRVRGQTQEKQDRINIFESSEIHSSFLKRETVNYDETIANDDENVPLETYVQKIDEDTLAEESMHADHIWSSYEAYSYILYEQTKALIQLGINSDVKQCVYMLYLRYLSSCGILKTNKTRETTSLENKRLKTLEESEQVYMNREEFYDKYNTRIVKKSLCAVNLDVLVSLLHCACYLTGQPVTIKQFVQWINDSKLPYYDIHKYLPKWMKPTGRDRFYLCKMTINTSMLFEYMDIIRSCINPYLNRHIFDNKQLYKQMLTQTCCRYSTQIYLPYNDIEFLIDHMCNKILSKKRSHKYPIQTTFDIELISLSILILIILLFSLNETVLDDFIQNINQYISDNQDIAKEFITKYSRRQFSYSLWLNNLEKLNQLEKIRQFQFFGRTSVATMNLLKTNHSLSRYLNCLSNVFRTIHMTNDYVKIEVENEEKLIDQQLRDNSKQNSLAYLFQTHQYFTDYYNLRVDNTKIVLKRRKSEENDENEPLKKRKKQSNDEHSPLMTESKEEEYERISIAIDDHTRVENQTLKILINNYSPKHFSFSEKLFLYNCLLSTTSVNLNQTRTFYSLHQRFHKASSSRHSLNHLVKILTTYCSIPYNQQFYSCLSTYLKYFYLTKPIYSYFNTRRMKYITTNHSPTNTTTTTTTTMMNLIDMPGKRKYGIDILPITHNFSREKRMNQKHKKLINDEDNNELKLEDSEDIK